jgi:DNA-binding PadR family transcriptional regulator
MTYTEVKRILNVSDGRLYAHVRKLIADGYVHAVRRLHLQKKETYYVLTDMGAAGLSAWKTRLEALLSCI